MSGTSSTAFTERHGRLKSIGASEVAAVLGICPFNNPVSVWARKVLQVEQPVSHAMRMGKVMEETIARLYEEETGEELVGDGETTHVSPFWPFLHATPDRWTKAGGKLVELKNVGFRSEDSLRGWGSSHTDEVPTHYKAQCQAQMAVLNCEEMDLAAFLGGAELRVYHLVRDHEFCTNMVQVVGDFHRRYVLTGERPPLDYSHPATLRTLARLENFTDPNVRMLNGDEEGLLLEYIRAGKAIAELEEIRQELKARILGCMGDSARAVSPSGHTATRKAVHRQAYQVAPGSYVRLDVHPKKEV